MKSFKQFIQERVFNESEDKNWRKEFVTLEKGFIPPSNLRPVIEAFLDSESISLTHDTTKEVNMPKKSLFLVGEAVRDFMLGKSPVDIKLATNATPEQIELILKNASFRSSTDGSQGGKTYSISTNSVDVFVNGQKFEVSTFRKDSEAEGEDFVDNPHQDTAQRDLTVNAMYLELTKPDGENKKLYDPTKKGYHDAHNKTVRVAGKAKESFEKDKTRILKALRLSCKFGKGTKMDKDTERAIRDLADLEGLDLETIRAEFLKGLDDKDVDPKKYVGLYARFGLINKVFPGLSINLDVPSQLRDKRDRYLSLAWILQNNSSEKVREALSPSRMVGDKEISTGWSSRERDVVSYFIHLNDFDPSNLVDNVREKNALGISKDQIKKWVDLFDQVDDRQVRNARPTWAKKVRSFANFEPDSTKLVTWFSKDDQGNSTDEIHPEIRMQNRCDVPMPFRNSVLKDINNKKLRQMFDEMN